MQPKYRFFRKFLYLFYLFSPLVLAVLIFLLWTSVNYAQAIPAQIRQVRVIETSDIGIQFPMGLAYSSETNVFYVLEAHDPIHPISPFVDLVGITPFEDYAGTERIEVTIPDPINFIYDHQLNRHLIFQSTSKKLIEARVKPQGNLSATTLIHHDLQDLGIQNPEGMALDPASGKIFILDDDGPKILQIDPDPNGDFENAAITQIDISNTMKSGVRGLAFDPSTENLHILNSVEVKLYEVTTSAEIVATRDLSPFNLHNPQGMVFAPSADMTDDPDHMHLFIADFDLPTNQVTENSATQPSGKIIEFSFTMAPASTADFTANLVQTIDASAFDPPSPDTMGITYLDITNTLLLSDSEVNETTLFTGDNLFEITLKGILSTTTTTIDFSDEPTGVAYNPGNGHVFITDDNQREVFEIDPGVDNQYGTSDDSITQFDTTAFGSLDPEGITFDYIQGLLFIVDGVNSEVYQVSPGLNDIFDGISPTGDDQVNSFDTLSQGIQDPEGIGFDPITGYLYVVGHPASMVAELTSAGSLVQMIDISAAAAVRPAGLAFTIGSLDQNGRSIYIADRGIDNNTDPEPNDGKVYELSMLPLPSGISGTISINGGAAYTDQTPVILNLSARDAGLGVDQMRFSNNLSTWSSWEPYSNRKEWTLTTADGIKRVYVQYKNFVPEISSTHTDTIILDTIGPTGSVNINAGSTYTGSGSVTLNLSANDAGSGVSQMRFSNNGSDWSAWEPYNTSKDWTLPSGDGTQTVYVQYKDNAGNPSSSFSDSIILDMQPPTGSIFINGDAPYVTSTSVTLNLSADDGLSGVDQMRFSNDGSNWASWEDFSISKSHNIPAGDGSKTVYVQYRDVVGNISSSFNDTIILDTGGPTGSILINSGEPYVNTTIMTLDLLASDAGSGVDHMRFSEDGSTWKAWEPYNNSKAWNVSSGDGDKTVYVQYRDILGFASPVYDDSIILDTTGPTGSILINADQFYTNDHLVTLSLSANDSGSGLHQMRFSSSRAWTPWESFSTTKIWELPPEDGDQTVYVQYQDLLGNISSNYNDMIVLDTTPPTVNITSPVMSIPLEFEINWSGVDETSGVASFDIQYKSGTGEAFTTWLSGTTNLSAQFGPNEPVTVVPGEAYTFRLRGWDHAGNVSAYSLSPQSKTTIALPIFLPSVTK